MANRCSVRGCSTVLLAGKENVHKLYRFPRDTNLSSKWKTVLKLHEISSSDRVCSLHFLDTDFIQTNLGWKVLTSFAVPSRNIDLSPSITYQEDISGSQFKENLTDETSLQIKQETETLHENPIKIEKETEESFEVPLANVTEIVSDLPSNDKEDANILIHDRIVRSGDLSSRKRPSDTTVFRPLKRKAGEPVKQMTSSAQAPHRDGDGLSKDDTKNNHNKDGLCEGDNENNSTCADIEYCPMCPGEFSSRMLLLVHMSLHLKSQKSVCKECGRIFFKKQDFEKHISNSCCSNLADELRCSSSDKHFICTLCDHTFSLRSALSVHQKEEHFRSSTPIKCLSCNINTQTTSDLKIHVMMTHLKNKLICTKCHRLFSTLAEMWCHTDDFDHGSQLECPECCERFSSTTYLIHHFKSHPCISFYSCEFCQLIFTSVECVETHVSKHLSNGASVVKCAFCMSGNQCQQSLHSQYHTHNYVSHSVPNNDIGRKRQVEMKAPCASSAVHSAVPLFEESCLPPNNIIDSVVKVEIEAPHGETSAVFSSASSALDFPKILCRDSKELKCENCNEVFGNESERSLHLKIHQRRGDFCCIECGVQCNSFKELTIHYEEHVKSEGMDGQWSSSEEDE